MTRNAIVITPFTIRNDWAKLKALEAHAAKLRKDYSLTRDFLISQGRADLLPDEFADRWKGARK